MTTDLIVSERESMTWRAFMRANLLLDAYIDAGLQAASGITHSGFIVISLLAESNGSGKSMTELAAHTQFSRSRLSHLIGRLETSGWVERKSSSNDRRSQIAVLTERGMATYENTSPLYNSIVKELFIDKVPYEGVELLQRIFINIVNTTGPKVSEIDRDRPTFEMELG